MLNTDAFEFFSMTNTNWEQILTDSRLISLPEVYLKLQQIISREDFSLAEITEVISVDPAVTARLLRMVNSAFFGLAARIETVSRAVNYLGAQQVHDLVLSTSIAQSFADMHNEAFDLHEFWRKSVYCAIAARELAVICNVLDSERLFVTGLLHDIGHLMMRRSLPELVIQAENLAEQQSITLSQAEKQVIGFDYAVVGAQLLKNWHLPDSLSDSIKYQLKPSRVEEYQLETAILNIAVTLTHGHFPSLDEAEFMVQVDRDALQISSINYQQISTADRLAQDNLNQVIELLFPQMSLQHAS